MKELEFPITRKKFLYVLLERKDCWALIEQVDLLYPDSPGRFEVWRIRVRGKRNLKGEEYPEMEVIPATTEWGQYGWTFFELRDAIAWFKDMISGVSLEEANRRYLKRR